MSVKNLISDAIKKSGFACSYGYKGRNLLNNTGDSLDKFILESPSIRLGNMPLTENNYFPESLTNKCSQGCYQNDTDYIMIKKERSHTNLLNNISTGSNFKLASIGDLSIGDYIVFCNNEVLELTN